ALIEHLPAVRAHLAADGHLVIVGLAAVVEAGQDRLPPPGGGPGARGPLGRGPLPGGFPGPPRAREEHAPSRVCASLPAPPCAPGRWCSWSCPPGRAATARASRCRSPWRPT